MLLGVCWGARLAESQVLSVGFRGRGGCFPPSQAAKAAMGSYRTGEASRFHPEFSSVPVLPPSLQGGPQPSSCLVVIMPHFEE